jgi:E3 ubiquitin-protein ligase BRE1
MSALIESYEKMVAENKKLMGLLHEMNKEKEDGIGKLSELSRTINDYKMCEESLAIERTELQKKMRELGDFKARTEKDERQMKIENEKLKNDYMDRQSAAKFHKRKSAQYFTEHETMAGVLEASKKKLEALDRDVREAKEQHSRLLLEKSNAEEDNRNLRVMTTYLMNGQSSEVLEDLEKCRKLLRCIACDQRYKDTVITKCMHVFCKDCVDLRIKTRQRQCPACGEYFNANDVKRIYL